jgi:hypothetical protein
VPATTSRMPVQLRRLVLLGTPLVLGILEIWHPTPSGTESTFDVIVDNADWWFTLHILQLPLFGLMALAVYLLVEDLHGWAATISRIGAWFFVVFYIALDSILGIAGGVIARGARRLPADQQAFSRAAARGVRLRSDRWRGRSFTDRDPRSAWLGNGCCRGCDRPQASRSATCPLDTDRSLGDLYLGHEPASLTCPNVGRGRLFTQPRRRGSASSEYRSYLPHPTAGLSLSDRGYTLFTL